METRQLFWAKKQVVVNLRKDGKSIILQQPLEGGIGIFFQKSGVL